MDVTGSVTSGVPQGSIFGHLLFIVCISDVDTGISCNVGHFADGILIGRAIELDKDVAMFSRMNKTDCMTGL